MIPIASVVSRLQWFAAPLVVVLSTWLAMPVRAEAPVLEFARATMGTRYMVKVFDPPEFDKDVRLEVDALLRHINDLMSTYLEHSELSRFNQSRSTDWFAVSQETAAVVAYAQSVSQKTDGAFDTARLTTRVITIDFHHPHGDPKTHKSIFLPELLRVNPSWIYICFS